MSRHAVRVVVGATVLASLLVPAVAAGAAARPTTATADPSTTLVPPLHTRGTTIYDRLGHVVRLTGVNYGGMDWGSGVALTLADAQQSPRAGYVTPETRAALLHKALPSTHSANPLSIYDNIAAWGFNTVRLPISWANLEPTAPSVSKGVTVHHWNKAYLEAIDDVVQQFTQRSIMVILDMHQNSLSPAVRSTSSGGKGGGLPGWAFPTRDMPLGGWSPDELSYEFFVRRDGQAGLAEAWAFLAARYKSNPFVVGADLLNEPLQHPPRFPGEPSVSSTAQDNDVDRMYALLGTAVQAANPNLLLAFEGGPPLAKLPRDNAGKPFPNTILSVHSYPDPNSSGISKVSADVIEARARHVPLWIGEFRVPCTLNGLNRSDCGQVPNIGSLPDISTVQALNLHTLLAYYTQNGVSWTYWEYEALAAYRGGSVRPLLLKTLQEGM